MMTMMKSVLVSLVVFSSALVLAQSADPNLALSQNGPTATEGTSMAPSTAPAHCTVCGTSGDQSDRSIPPKSGLSHGGGETPAPGKAGVDG